MFTCPSLHLKPKHCTLSNTCATTTTGNAYAHLVLGADAVAANLASLYVLQLQLGDQLLDISGTLDVILVAEHKQGDACESGLLNEVQQLVAGDIHSVGVGAVHNVNDGIHATAVPRKGASSGCETKIGARLPWHIGSTSPTWIGNAVGLRGPTA